MSGARRTRAFLFFALYLAWLLYRTLSGDAFVTLDDDVYLQTFLYHGENGTYIMSHPLSTLLASLYGRFPHFPWFSAATFLFLLLAAAVFARYAAESEDPLFAPALALSGLVYLDFLVTNVSVTTLTVTFMALAVPSAGRSPALFWALLFAASLLRFPVVIAFSPLLLLAWAALSPRFKIPLPRRPLPIFLALLTLVNLASNLYYGKEYLEWLRFRNAHQYFIDFHGKPAPGVLNPFEERLVDSWIIQDEALLPSSKVIEADRGKLTAIAERLLSVTPRQVASKIYHTPLLFLALLLALFIVAKRGWSPSRKAALVLMLGAIVALLLSRDVERVTVPLLLMAIATEITLLLGRRMRRLATAVLLLAALFVWRENLRFNRIHSPAHLAWAKEQRALLARYPHLRFERAIFFPTNYDRERLWSAVLQSRLFDEDNWFTRRILPADWVSRHPLFYRLHEISHGGVERVYENYHEWLLSKKSAFIGGGDPNTDLTPKILAFYDRLYPPPKGCRHAVRIVDRSENFAVSRIVISCPPDENGTGKTAF